MKELTAGDDSSFASVLPEDDGEPQAMEVDEKPAGSGFTLRFKQGVEIVGAEDEEEDVKTASIELEAYFHLFTVIRLLDDGKVGRESCVLI
jgi:hypothetical protein